MTGYRPLRTQRELVGTDLARLAGLVQALDRAITTVERGNPQQEETMLNGFAPSEYEDEVRERWDHTEAYKESARRTSSYVEEQWHDIKAQAQEIERLFGELKRSGQPAAGEPARAAAEQARLHIDRWFYPCSREMHRTLGNMYVSDPRFAANYQDRARTRRTRDRRDRRDRRERLRRRAARLADGRDPTAAAVKSQR